MSDSGKKTKWAAWATEELLIAQKQIQKELAKEKEAAGADKFVNIINRRAVTTGTQSTMFRVRQV